MRKIPAAAAVLGLMSLALVGCTSVGASSCARPTSDADVLSAVTVDGDIGEQTTVDVHTPFSTKKTVFEDTITGRGTPITSSTQVVAADLTVVDGTTGVSTPLKGESGGPLTLSVKTLTDAAPGLKSPLHCATPGTRIVAALPPGKIDPTSFGLTADDTGVLVIDVRDVLLPRAEGSLVFNDAQGLPSVVRAPDGRPGIIVPDATEPSKKVVQTLIKGNGAKIAKDDTVVATYTSVSWSDRKVITTTWGDDGQVKAVDLSTAAVPFDSLIGKTIGSQVLVVAPKGTATDADAPKDQAVVYVIDVLGLVPGATAAK